MIFHARTSTLMCHCFPQAHSCSAPFPSVPLFVGSYSSARYAACLLPNTYGAEVEVICCGFFSAIFFYPRDVHTYSKWFLGKLHLAPKKQ
jgi:hypothetical protein